MGTPRLLFASLLTLLSLDAASAQDWPNRPIRWIVPVAPGGQVDITSRLIQEPLARILGQNVIIENKPGGAGIPTTEQMSKAPPDGYAFTIITTSHATNPWLTKRLPYDSDTGITPVAFIWSATNAMSVHPEGPYKSLADVIAAAKKDPAAISYATGGVGTSSHITGTALERIAGVKLTHIPYRGAPAALIDIFGGRVPMLIGNISIAAPLVAAGKLRTVAVAGAQRSALLPDVPTVGQAGFSDIMTLEWLALAAPPGLPPDILHKMNKAVAEVIAQPAVAAEFKKVGLSTNPMPPDELRAFIKLQTDMNGKLIKEAGIQPE